MSKKTDTIIFMLHGQSISSAEIPDEVIDSEFRSREKLMYILRAQFEEKRDGKEADDFTIDVLRRALLRKGAEIESWVPEVFRMIAEGRNDDALHVMKAENPELAPPSHERAIADLLSYGRA